MKARGNDINNGMEKQMCLRRLGVGKWPNMAAVEDVVVRHEDL